jgi:chromosome segregation ATPase
MCHVHIDSESLELDQQRLQSKLKLVERTIPELEERLVFSERTREHLKGQLEQTLLAKLDAENGSRIIAEELTRLRDAHKLVITGYQRDHESSQDKLRSTNKEREQADSKRVEAEEQARAAIKQIEAVRRDIAEMKQRESSFLNNIKWLEEQLEENQRQHHKMLSDQTAADNTERLAGDLGRLQDSHSLLKKYHLPNYCISNWLTYAPLSSFPPILM